MFPAFERAKTVHASDRAATVIGLISCIIRNIELDRIRSCPNLLYYPRICLEGLWGTMKIDCVPEEVQTWDLQNAKSEALPLQPT
jgi:hypothetical protein